MFYATDMREHNIHLMKREKMIQEQLEVMRH